MTDYLINATEAIPVAHYKLSSVPEKVLFVIDSNGRLCGFVTPSSFPPFSERALAMKVSEIMRHDTKAIGQDVDQYAAARNIIAEYPSINVVPILDLEVRPIRLLKRWQLFFKDEYFRAVRTREPVSLPYPQYAVAIWRAANVARAVGVDCISVLEFGVAQGEGLVACEELAEVIGRIWDVKIDVYGFDGAAGLPEISDYRDCPQCWDAGLFPMDRERLQGRLQKAKLITGDIAQTWFEFLRSDHAPIGAMLVDVDYYTSTVPILTPLEGDCDKFLPIVSMYFDDIGGSLQFQGEALAIREFNQRNVLIKISPESESFGEFNFGGRRYGFSKLKACMFYGHPLFTAAGFRQKIMHDFWR